MTLLDAYALIEMLGGGPAERQVRAILDTGEAAIATANLVEVLDYLVRVRGIPSDDVQAIVDPLLEVRLRTVPLDLGVARRAGAIRTTHYHRRHRRLSFADCVLLASGGAGDQVATADADVLAVAPLVGVEPVALPAGA